MFIFHCFSSIAIIDLKKEMSDKCIRHWRDKSYRKRRSLADYYYFLFHDGETNVTDKVFTYSSK